MKIITVAKKKKKKKNFFFTDITNWKLKPK